MVDFLMISTKSPKKDLVEIYPKFKIKNPSSDLMIRGGDFYAVWLEDLGLWSTNEQDALDLIDRELDLYYEENKHRYGDDIKVRVLHMWDAESGMIDRWHKYCQKQMRDNFEMLDEKLIFSNMDTTKKDYASKKLPYPLEKGDCPAYDKLMSTLYNEDERHKLEWAIGSIVSGDSKKLQKFMVLYGAAGTGKSTVLNIIQQLFDGYYSVFDARALGSSSNSFALEAFKSNPLVAIQHDGDLSRIEDNTRLNSLVSHELMTVNEKFKTTYSNRFKCFLFMGTNKPVKITDAKSGLIRRLIDVSPSGNKLAPREYKSTIKKVGFELGAIAYHCQEVYLDDPGCYDDYIPLSMMGASNDFYNFMLDSYHIFKSDDGVSLKSAWEMYKSYCDEAKVGYPYPKRIFKEELKNYFENYDERFNTGDGNRVRSYYSGFKTDKFERNTKEESVKKEETNWLIFDKRDSLLDKALADCPAQYTTSKETPTKKWNEVTSKLSDLNTSRLHYVKVPESHIVIDFDIPDENGKKCYERNLAEASKWPPTYAELSKSGAGIHLHYIYSGDPTKLSRVYDDHIEIKVFSGKSSLRRKLTKCNDIPIATISSGLPLKGEKMINFEAAKSEKGLRTLIKKNLCKEIHPGTKPSVDFIYKILEDAYNSGLHYDVTDMRNAILAFAAGSTHQADYCIKLVNKMSFKSDDISESVNNDDAKMIFYDIEVFPNLFLVNWKVEGADKPVVRMINPSPAEIEDLIKFRLVGFNCRRYDNHILYARLMGYSNFELFNLSQKIINKSENCFFGEAYNISYTDVYDFASAGHKQSLKKFEIELGIHHQELGLPWDEPVPEDKWQLVAEYCDNDVIATEATFNYLKGDWEARKSLAKIAGGTVNDTTNSLTTKLIFGNNRNPQDQFVYTDLSTLFPGYKYDHGKSSYRDVEVVGEGGRVWAKPGMYTNVKTFDVASMHPHSIIALNLFGDYYTQRFKELVDARIIIKHTAKLREKVESGKITETEFRNDEEVQKLSTIFGSAFSDYVSASSDELSNLASALKTAINSVYGLTAAKFENPFRDPRNIDNIVAKRGALFMIDLHHLVEEAGGEVVHIKTDSIKVANPTQEIEDLIYDYGRKWGYNFEVEAEYEKICLVNNAVYIAKEKATAKNPAHWTATGAQFAVPYTFKTLFSKEPIVFEDMCETKSVTTNLYLDMNEELPDVSELEKDLERITKKAKEFGVNMDTGGNSGDSELDEMVKEITKGHSYHFVGKVGQFCPMKPGSGGGELVRETKDKNGTIKYSSATGAKGYRWLESEMVRTLGKEKDIDRSYYDKMVDEAVASISEFGDFEWFISDDPIEEPYVPKIWPDDVPFDGPYTKINN